MKASFLRSALSPTALLVVSTCIAVPSVHAQRTTVTVQAAEAGKQISPLLFGIFFEDLNYAADGGLYAELIQNRSFEYQATEQRGWNNLTSWELVTRGTAKGNVLVADSFPLNANNPHYVVMGTDVPGDGVGLMNAGYDGIPVKAGESYDVSFFARKHYVAGRWDGNARARSRSSPESSPPPVRCLPRPRSISATASGSASPPRSCRRRRTPARVSSC